MDHTHPTFTSPVNHSAPSERGFIDILIALAKRKKQLIWLPFGAAALTAAVSLAVPNVYSAGAKLLPPQQPQSGAAALLSQLGGVASAVAGTAGLKNPNDLYVGILKSRTVADRLIERFQLKKVYDTDSMERARSALEQNTTIAAGKDGLITIAVEDKNQELVAKVANAYVEELLNLTKTLAITEASKRRVFFERQFEITKNNLASAEAALKQALDSRGVISVDSDSRAMLETVGRLRAQVSAKEIQLNSMSAFVTAQNPEYKRVQEELASLRVELSKLENGRGDAEGNLTNASRENKSGLANIKLLRDVKYYQMLYELLAKQYEASRLEEAKDPSIVQVLDPAIQPEKKIKPKRALIVLFSYVAAFFVTMLWIFFKEGFFGNIMGEDSEKLRLLKEYLKRKSR
jgi:uncharacterized protein involved in exopolysaccharide biosynthesis